MTTTRTVEHRHIDWTDVVPALRNHAEVRTEQELFDQAFAEDRAPVFCNETQDVVGLEEGSFGGTVLQECTPQHWRFVSTLISRDDPAID